MENLSCLYCKKKFSSTQALKLHTKTAKKCLLSRGNSELLDCDYCEKEFPGEESLQRHLLTCKSKEKMSHLFEENRILKEELSTARKELEKFRAFREKELTSSKNTLLDVEDFQKEFFDAFEKVPTDTVIKG
ncbi:multiple zinc ribbon protein [Tokyovirus A1]|uniref:multiple zinc ribbon protein n=1 Tax=Tokyovirus A1 TaxID=1826170 RepID=UPI0007A96249|nr:multiple zinc ribbon protein [Tokyovirus A1]BAU80305.1 multiple zinc ribbon protein [Tokyovirus A1]